MALLAVVLPGSAVRAQDAQVVGGPVTERRAVGDAIEEAQQALADATARIERREGRLAEASDQLTAAESRFTAATDAAVRARRRLEKLDNQLRRAEHALERDRQRLRAVARDAYKHGMGTDPLLAALTAAPDANGPADLAHLQHSLKAVLGDRADVVDRLLRRVEVVRQLRAEARSARAQRRTELAAAEEARAEAARLHAELEQGLDEAIADRQRQADLLTALTGEREQLEQRLAELATVPAPTGDLATVEGITVAAELAPRLEALLADARADGIELGGWGWRSTQRQVELRRINGCPDIATSPASACRVPTARPGQSQHETGLAIDFTWQGETLCYPLSAASCRGTNPAFDWLDANAHRYGLQVLPSEAWHWSTTGR